jgi:hypothetical protein
MSAMGQSRPFAAVRRISAAPLITDIVRTRRYLDPTVPFMFDPFFFAKRAEFIDSTASISIFLTE